MLFGGLPNLSHVCLPNLRSTATYSCCCSLPPHSSQLLNLDMITVGCLEGGLRSHCLQAADDANKVGADQDTKQRGTFLRVLEAALVAAHKPVTLILPAATTILALR